MVTDRRKRRRHTSFGENTTKVEHSDHNYYKKAKSAEQHVDSNSVIEETSSANFDHSYSIDPEVSFSRETGFIGTRDCLVTRLRKKIKQLQQQLRMKKSEYSQLVSNMNGFLNSDQIRYLKIKSKRNIRMRWSNATIKSSLQLRYATGRKGYAHLRRQGYPIPACRTLCERVEQAQFRPGIQTDVLEWLRVKIETQHQAFKDFSVALDEMQLRPCIEYDKGESFYTP